MKFTQREYEIMSNETRYKDIIEYLLQHERIFFCYIFDKNKTELLEKCQTELYSLTNTMEYEILMTLILRLAASLIENMPTHEIFK